MQIFYFLTSPKDPLPSPSTDNDWCIRNTAGHIFIALIFIYPIFGMTYVITCDKFRTTGVCTSLEIFLWRHSLADVLGSVQVRQTVSGSCRNVLQTRGPTLLVPMMYCFTCSSLSGVVTVWMLTHRSILCPLIGWVYSAGTNFGIFLIFYNCYLKVWELKSSLGYAKNLKSLPRLRLRGSEGLPTVCISQSVVGYC